LLPYPPRLTLHKFGGLQKLQNKTIFDDGLLNIEEPAFSDNAFSD
jgi:hypothetical protein